MSFLYDLTVLTSSASIGNIDMPLSIIQILWANIIADLPPATALGVEPYEVDIMDRSPRDPKEGVLTRKSWLMIFLQSLIMSFLSFLVYIFSGAIRGTAERGLVITNGAFLLPSHQSIAEQRSMVFLVLTSMQLFQGFLSRSVWNSSFKTGFTGNKWAVYAFFTSLISMILGFYLPGLNTFLELVPVGGIDWAVTIVCCVIQFVLVELLKLAFKKYDLKKRYRRVDGV